eukprot:scaffold1900_cov389-Prasinococcus_capsulatus_cf.AAC.4
MRLMASQAGEPGHYSLHYLAFRAKLGNGDPEGAAQELDALAHRPESDVQAVMHCIQLMAATKSIAACVNAFQKHAAISHDAASLYPSFCLALLGAIKEQAEAEDSCPSLLEVLDFFSCPDTVASIVRGGGVQTAGQSQVFVLLWNAACAYFESRKYANASKTFEVAELYARPGSDDRDKSCKSAIALTHIMSEDFLKAATTLEDMKLAGYPVSVRDSFLLFKAHIHLGNDIKAMETLQQMTEADDFHSDYLTLSASEAISADLKNVGVQCLQNLLVRKCENSPAASLVCRNLIRLMVEDGAPKTDVLTVFEKLNEMIVSNGVSATLGRDDAAEKECSWFAYHAYHCGLECVTSASEKSSAEGWALASRFFCTCKKFASMVGGCPTTLQSFLSWSCFWNAIGMLGLGAE